ncbi:MAG: polysaccharide biosynthesis C-terminal domain-containing protein [Lentimicrobium sp.]|nr:polysaccharide biosynthesis C-terminal domain-containing protein [Lentimicrobium sp.]
MFSKILSTTAARLMIALLNLGIVTVAARALGAEGMGTISLFILGISILQLFSALAGGSVLVYMVARYPIVQLIFTAWAWTLFVSAIGSFILIRFKLSPAEFNSDLFFVSLLQGLFAINQNIQLGKEKIAQYNFAAIAQVAILLFSLLIMFYFSENLGVKLYINALYLSFGFAFLLSFSGILKYFSRARLFNPAIIRETFRFGSYVQVAGILQLFNYRLSYYIIEKFFDRATLGIFSIGVQISESVWIISKSIALVQYSKISNSTDKAYNIKITIDFIKFTLVFTLMMIAVLLLLPADFFAFIFRNDFRNVGEVILSISAGILAVAISLMFSHYFSGSGKPWHNTISSGIGLAFTLILGFTLIPILGITGAGITSSAAYTASMMYQYIVFKKLTSTPFSRFIPTFDDFIKLGNLIKELRLM